MIPPYVRAVCHAAGDPWVRERCHITAAKGFVLACPQNHRGVVKLLLVLVTDLRKCVAKRAPLSSIFRLRGLKAFLERKAGRISRFLFCFSEAQDERKLLRMGYLCDLNDITVFR